MNLFLKHFLLPSATIISLLVAHSEKPRLRLRLAGGGDWRPSHISESSWWCSPCNTAMLSWRRSAKALALHDKIKSYRNVMELNINKKTVKNIRAKRPYVSLFARKCMASKKRRGLSIETLKTKVHISLLCNTQVFFVRIT